MGSPEGEKERNDDEKQHEVTLTKGFWLANTACTQELWEAVMGHNPSKFKDPQRPVDGISWDDCQKFLTKIKNIPELTDVFLRLPTEAMWEYACRAETITPFSFGENVTPDQVNYDGTYPYSGGKIGKFKEATVDVKSFLPNGWGLYEMHGNVREWCSDWYGEYSLASVSNPIGPEMGSKRVLRGGSWNRCAGDCRSAFRYSNYSNDRRSRVGFRLSRCQ